MKEMSDKALDSVIRTLKTVTVGTVKGTGVALMLPVKISAAIAKAAAEEAREKLDK